MAHTEETIKKWKQEFSWLLFLKSQKIVCAVYISQKEIIHSTRNFNDTFIVDSTKYQLSSTWSISQRVINKLSKKRITIKHWRKESVYNHKKLFIMYFAFLSIFLRKAWTFFYCNITMGPWKKVLQNRRVFMLLLLIQKWESQLLHSLNCCTIQKSRCTWT